MGHSLCSDAAAAPAAAACAPAAAASVPEIDISQPTTQVQLSLKSFLLPPSPPNPLSRTSIPPSPSRQIAVVLLDGRRERLTLNQSFTGEPKLCDPFSSQRCCRTVCLVRDTASLCPAVGHLYARVSEFTPPGISFTLSGGFPPTLLTDHSATLASAALLNVLVRQAKS